MSENAAVREVIARALFEWVSHPDRRGYQWNEGPATRDEIMQRPYLDQADAVLDALGLEQVGWSHNGRLGSLTEGVGCDVCIPVYQARPADRGTE